VTLLGPGFLVAGLLATAVPIVIFLLWRQRRRPVRWGAMRFLIEAEQRQHRRLQLEKWLLLAIRCLAIIALGAALAQPLLEAGGLIGGGGRRTVLLVIDDGMTSGLRDPDGPAAAGDAGTGADVGAAGDAAAAGTVLADHVAVAAELIASLEPGDRVGVVTAARGGADLLPPSTDLDAVVRWLEALEPAAVPADLTGALRVAGAAANEAVATGEDPSIHLLSEFRAGSAELEESLSDLGLPATVPLLAREAASDIRSNVSVVAIDPVRSVILPGAADGSGQLSVRLRRHGELAAGQSTVRIEVPGLAAIEPRTVTWAPGQADASVDVRLPIEPGEARALPVTASVDGDALAVDDARSLVLEARPSLRVAVIDRRNFGRESSIDRIGAGGWFERALQPGEGASLDVVRIEPAALTVPDLREVEAAIVPRPDLLRPEGWQRLADFAARGGLVVVSPPEDATVHQWVDEFQRVFSLDWQVERATERLDVPQGLAAPRRASSLLGLLAGELEDLVRPVLVDRRLSFEPDEQTDVLLRTEDDRAWLAATWIDAPGGSGLARVARGADEPVRLGDDEAAGASAGPAAAGAPVGVDRAATEPGRGGLLVVFAVAPMLEWTNLPTKPLMVPLVQELVRQGIGLTRAESRTRVGERPMLVRHPAADTLIAPDGTVVPVGADGRPVEALARPGVYRVRDQAGGDLGAIAVSIESAGGRTETQPADAVGSWLARAGRWTTLDTEAPGAVLQRGGGGAGLTRPLLMLLALLLVAESLLSRRFSRVVTARGIGGATAGSIMPTLSLQMAGRSGSGSGSGSGVESRR
jgi:hypothetical protein